jgi:hypothetical protein
MKHQYDDLFNEMDKVFKEVDRAFKNMDETLSRVMTESDDFLNSKQKWEPYISWMPRKIGKRWFWHSPIYRKAQYKKNKIYYVYGTEFDVLKSSK